MRDEPLGDPFAVSIDLNKLKGLPDATFIMRLMMAINDVQSIYYLSILLGDDKKDCAGYGATHHGTTGFLLKMQASILAEAVHTFVIAFSTQTQKSPNLKRLIKDGKRQKLWKALCDAANDSRYAELVTLRHNLGFHYDHEEHNPHTLKALEQLISEAGTSANSFVGIQDSKPTTPMQYRYVVADATMLVAWRRIFGNIPIDNSRGQAKLKIDELNAYVIQLGAAFVRWGREAIKYWIDKNGVEVTQSRVPRSDDTSVK